MALKLGYGVIGLSALLLSGGLMLYNYLNRPLEVAPVVSYQETAVLQPYPELEDIYIRINEATTEELQLLPGIGVTRAQAILEYIESHGPITDPEQLLEVPGIGEKILEQIRPYLVL